MLDMTNPELLKTPLAKNGDKNTLPLTTGATTGLFSQDLGFQEINSTPLTAGGKAPDRKDFNGAFNLLGGVAFMAQKGWTFHYDSTQDYYLGCVVIDPADGNRYECIADMAAGTVAPHEDADGDYWRRYTLGDGEDVGIIKAFAGNGDIPAGYLLCDGSAVSRTMFPDLFATIGTTYGAGDGSTTFNVPDYNTAQRFAQGSTVAGVEKDAGLPNIEGTFNGTSGAQPTGAFSKDSEILLYASGTGTGRMSLSFDASNSNPIYGNSDTVQPESLTTRYIIKAFDGQTADSALIDITQYAQELAGKADRQLSNLDTANLACHVVVDSYYDSTTGDWWREYDDGWVEQGGVTSSVTVTTTAHAVTTLLKAMASTDYDLIPTGVGSIIATDAQNKTTTTIDIYLRDTQQSGTHTHNFNWMVCGMGAQS